MRKHVVLTIIIVLVFTLCACNNTEKSSDSASPKTLIEETTPTLNEFNSIAIEPTLSEESVYVYENAIEDYLLPIEEFSWERKYDPTHIMIHFTSAIATHPEDPYNVQYIRDIFVEYDISIHYIIERDGTVRCYVPEDQVAWHAGTGKWKDDERYTNDMNQYAIGIEMVAIGSESDMATYLTSDEYKALDDDLKGYTDEQYESLRKLVGDLCERYYIPMDREHVIGHEEYSESKTDPGELFDWGMIIGEK